MFQKIRLRAMCPTNPVDLLHGAYWRGHTCILSIFIQSVNAGLLGLLCLISMWYFPFVCPRSNGLSIGNRVLVSLPFLQCKEYCLCPWNPAPHCEESQATWRSHMDQVGTVVTAPAKVSADLQPQPQDIWADELQAIAAPASNLVQLMLNGESHSLTSHLFLQVLTKL